ncbi:MAG: cytidylate kinase-like family protein [Nitrospirota bacterium]|jgi:cytidylate kinase
MAGNANLKGYVRAVGARVKQRQKSPPPYVTISRESGAGGREVGEALTRLLTDARRDAQWKCYDRELVDEIIADHHLSETLRSSLEEEQVSRLDDWVSSVIEHKPPQVVLAEKTARTVRSLALRGHAVILGRGGGVLTHDLPHGLHVRLIAPKAVRLTRKQAQARQQGRELHEADLDRIDAARAAYVRSYWGADQTDPHNYDLVLNTHCLGIEACARLIASVVLECEERLASESEDAAAAPRRP